MFHVLTKVEDASEILSTYRETFFFYFDKKHVKKLFLGDTFFYQTKTMKKQDSGAG